MTGNVMATISMLAIMVVLFKMQQTRLLQFYTRLEAVVGRDVPKQTRKYGMVSINGSLYMQMTLLQLDWDRGLTRRGMIALWISVIFLPYKNVHIGFGC